MEKKFFAVEYTDKYNSGQDRKIEVILQSEKDFKKWIRQHNEERLKDGEIPESADDFSITPVNLFI